MFLRFTVPGAVTRARQAPGPFNAASSLMWAHWGTPVGEALWLELDWFNQHLPVPSGTQPFAVRAKRRWFRDGVCWFRAEAAEAIAHMNVMAALIEDCGVPVTRHVSRHPGQVLYRDRFQVVAKRDWHWCKVAPPLTARPVAA